MTAMRARSAPALSESRVAMKIDLLPVRDLSPHLVAQWDEIQRSRAEFSSPYFRPEFVRTVAAVRDNVEVGVLHRGGRVMGFFPFERRRRAVATPVAGKLSDYQAVICRPDCEWTVRGLLAGCRVSAWEFDHQIACQHQFAPFVVNAGQSPQLDLSAGFQAWQQERRGARLLDGMLRKLRKLEREQDVHFEWHTTAERAFEQLQAWKVEQYCRTGATNVFAHEWVVRLLRDIWHTQLPGFAGVFSTLHINGALAAVHFNMRSERELHSWFPAYNPALSNYSPGTCLLLMIAREAAVYGVTCIDLGKGDEEYKLAMANRSVLLGEGVVETRRIAGTVRAGWRVAKDWVRQTPLKAPAKASLRWLRSMQTWIGASP